jgi:hypothetical protein
MNEQCGIIRDLLPLYHDGVCSDESRELVSAHLKTCEDCAAELDKIKSDFNKPSGFKTTEQAKVDILKRFKAKIFRKNVFVAAISVAVTLAILTIGYWGIFIHETPIAYHDGMLTVNLAADEVLDVYYNDGRYACARAIERKIIEGGTKKTVLYLNYSGTFWTRHFAKVSDVAQTQFSVGKTTMIDFGGKDGTSYRIPIDSEDPAIDIGNNGEISFQIPSDSGNPDISAIYYLDYFNGNFNDLALATDADFMKMAENAVLLWER